VLIEQAARAACLHAGCVPSKALIAAGRRAHAVAQAAAFGVPATGTVDFGRVHDHVHGVIAAIAPNDSAERLTGLGVRVIAGAARFTDKRTVAVGEDIAIKARRFVIATGSRPALPPIPGSPRRTTNETCSI
jgi:pyruvate/2-oxoglutarate dehydrogenase complex dihydrolipoamide dehydrogenase (E3) component